MGAKDLSDSNPLLDKGLAQAFVDGVLKTLTNIASTEAKPGKPIVEKGYSGQGDVAGLIGMISGGLKGTITVSFTKEAVLKIYENMLGEVHSEIDDEVADCVGELTNMIYGSAKTTLNEIGYNFEMAIPTVIVGKVKITGYHSGTTLVVPFSVGENLNFFVEITVQTA